MLTSDNDQNQVTFDLGGVYERCKENAKSAVAASPNSDFALDDVMPEEQWLAFLSSGMGAIGVLGMLNGSFEALIDRETTAQHVRNAPSTPPSGTEVTKEDMQVARSWLADVLESGIDEAGRQALVDREVNDRGWVMDVTRLSSLMIALVVVAGAAVDH